MSLFGYRPDTHVLRGLYSHWVHSFGLVATPPPRDLRSFAPHILNQIGSSCVGHGTSTGIVTCAGAAGHPLGFIPSPSGIYTNAVAIERGDPAAGPLRDVGSMPALAMRGLSEFGICSMVPANADTDCAPSNGLLAEPDLLGLELEGKHLYVGWYVIANADEARTAIAAGAPVGVGTYVDSAFMRWTPQRPPLGYMNQSDPNGGGHWTVLLASEASERFWLRNSWGTGWGLNGEALVTDDFVNQADQLIAFGWKGAAT